MPRQRFPACLSSGMRRVYRRIAPENVERPPAGRSNMLRMQGTTFDFWIFQMCRARRTLLLRGSTRLARLLAECARRTEAYDELAKVYGSFTEGFETVDSREARAVLDGI